MITETLSISEGGLDAIATAIAGGVVAREITTPPGPLARAPRLMRGGEVTCERVDFRSLDGERLELTAPLQREEGSPHSNLALSA